MAQQQQQIQQQPQSGNAQQRIQDFLATILTETASANALERELASEKCKKRKAEEKRRKLKFRIKTLLEDLKAVELSIFQSETKISNFENELYASVSSLR